jgi:hypothetical protein
MDLGDVIDQTPGVRVVKGTVIRITGDTFTMGYLGGEVPGVSHLDQYTPIEGDIVHALVIPRGGWLAIGSTNGTGTDPGSVPFPPITGTVTADGFATYIAGSGGAWVTGTLAQAPDRMACWFYDISLFSTYDGAALASFEIEITRTSGGPLDMQLHNTAGAGGALSVAAPGPYVPTETPPVGTPTWVALPVGWGELLASGQARGVGIGLGQHNGVYAGTGRLRFTTI